MKYRERLGYIALGGFLMLVGMLAGAFSPLGSHDEKADLNVGEITCTGLSVVDEDGLRVLIRNGVAVLGKTGGMAERLGCMARTCAQKQFCTSMKLAGLLRWCADGARNKQWQG